MSFCLNEGLIKIIQKVFLTAITTYLYTRLSLLIPSCSLTEAGLKIFPFDKIMFSSSVLFLSSAAIIIVECDVWPYNTKPHSRIIQFFGELYIMTAYVLFTYTLFWHPIVIATSIITDELGKLTSTWLASENTYKKSVPICMNNIRSTKFHSILLGVLLFYNVLDKFGRNDLRRIRSLF
ncbi:uncharacterized protein LOC112680809 [Sipha flava]|uniref:Uncharacterized protein LOC112680809 n=1 Tax=Sipha flava TaxID=143950 RepID=A0A8B8F8Q6_9HEMI|nr:uncharacterized protein LOC112680809 [Sipha flava]